MFRDNFFQAFMGEYVGDGCTFVEASTRLYWLWKKNRCTDD